MSEQQSNDTDEKPQERKSRRDDRKWALAGGIAAALVGFGGMAVVGTAAPFEARRLLESVLPTTRFAASAYVAGGGTILALMLTLITFSISHNLEFRASHYKRIREISTLTTMCIVGSVMLLMFLSFPIGEVEVEQNWYVWVYYAVLLGGAVTGGVFISVIMMLLYAVRGLIVVAEDPESSSMVITNQSDEE